MANIKITDLSGYTDPESTDVLPIVDVTNDETKKVSIADLMENAGSGTEALPGIAFDGDPNTGIYRPGADQLAISTAGTQRLLISNTGAVTIPGDLTVQGTTTTIDSETLVVKDKNIEMGSVTTPTDTTADGGGITLKGATDKTINWVNSTDAWTSSERFDFPAGTEATPSIILNGDVNSGIYQPGADQVAVATNGAGRLFVDASGNVGVGTSSPSGLLEIAANNQSASNTLRFTDTDTAVSLNQQIGRIEFYGTDSGGAGAGVRAAITAKAASTSQNSYLTFSTSSTSANDIERLRITDVGNVGIGTASPGQLLQVGSANGAIRVGGGAGLDITHNNSGSTVSEIKQLYATTSNAAQLKIISGFTSFHTGTSNTERLRITSTGQLSHIGGGSSGSPAVGFNGSAPANSLVVTSTGAVGIGTSSPGDKVHIEGAGQQTIRIRNTTEGSNASPQSSFIAFRGYYNVALAQIEVQDRSSSNFGGWINVSTSNSSNVLTNAIHIDSSQRVGIGTTTPGYPLHVFSSTSTVGIRVDGGGDSIVSFANAGSAVGAVGIAAGNIAGGGSGNIGIQSGSSLLFATGGVNEKARIDSSGRLGIGTGSPSEALTVSGKIQATTEFKSETGNDLRLNAGSVNRDIFMQVNGSTLMTVQGSTGRVGIGTASPGAPLAVATASDTADLGRTGLTIGGSSTLTSGDVLMLNFTPIGANSNRARAGVGCVVGSDWGKGNLTFYTLNASSGAAMTSAAERMRITDAGLVGIGTSSPSSILQVSSTGTSGGDATLEQGPIFRFDQGASNIDLNGVDNWHLKLHNSAYAGAGVSGSQGTITKLLFNGVTSNGWNSYGYISLDTQGTSGDRGDLVFGTGGPAERMRITSAGRVGIGTTSPNYKLDIFCAQDDGLQIYETSSGNNRRLRITQNANGVFYDATYSAGLNAHAWGIGGGEAARIDSSGRLLVGTAIAPTQGTYAQTALLTVQGYAGGSAGRGAINIASGSAAASLSSGFDVGTLAFSDNSGGEFARISCFADAAPGASDFPGRLTFSTTADGASSPTERMRITNNGNVFINSPSNPALGIEMFGVAAQGSGQTTAAGFANTVSTSPTVFVVNASNTTNTYLMRFASGSLGTTRGEIYYNGSQLVYATSSDYRLKENVVSFENGAEIVKQLRPVRYNWIENGNEDIGFIAHEVQAVFPNAVGGEKDAVDDDGKILPQTYDPSKLVPLLTAALQEAIGEIESLKARLTAAGI